MRSPSSSQARAPEMNGTASCTTGGMFAATRLSGYVDRKCPSTPGTTAIAAPRATQRNTASVQAEPTFPRTDLEALGHTFADNPEIGAATGIELTPDGFVAAAEPVRRGGGSAGVVDAG